MRGLLLLEIFVYGTWWPVIRYTEPFSYNPLWSRLLVVIPPFLIFLASYRIKWVAANLENLFYASVYGLMLHNLYAKHVNYDNVAWPMATYITVAATSACFQSAKALAYFSLYTLIIGTYIATLHDFLYPFYIPGLVTIVLVMNLTLYFRNRALRQLDESKARFEKLFNAVFEGIALHERGTILAVNESFANLFGYTREEMIGTSVLDRVAARSMPTVTERIASDLEEPYEAWGTRRDGTTLPIEISIKRHHYQGRAVRMIAVRDMSERYLVESERRKKLEAQAAVELRDQFISIASHELRTPLTPLKLGNDILTRMVREKGIAGIGEAQVLKMLQTSSVQIGRITRLIDDMLDVSSISSGQFELRLECFDLRECLDTVIGLCVDEKSARTKVRVRLRGDLTVCWDRLRMEQVLVNLLKNALLYGKSSPVVISIAADRQNVAIFVRDRGMGVAPEMQSRIFERFERGVSAKNYGGLGLGLYIVRQIVKSHRGDIRVKSEVGKGTCFAMVLPKNAQPAFVMFKPEVVQT